jgi:hypothetical protein
MSSKHREKEASDETKSGTLISSGLGVVDEILRRWSAGVREHRSQEGVAAQRALNDRVGKIARGEPVLPRLDRVMYAEAAIDLREYDTSSGGRDVKEAGYKLAHLGGFFAHYRLAAIGPAGTTRYTVKRLEEGASNATINRELAVLGRMLRLAYENGKLARLPLIRKLKEAAPRQGFLSGTSTRPCAGTCPTTSRPRARSRTRSAGGCRAKCSCLSADTSTSPPARCAWIPAARRTARAGWCTSRRTSRSRSRHAWTPCRSASAGSCRTCSRTSPGRSERGHSAATSGRRGRPACKAAGVPGMLRHDFRRTAVRNMERTGISRSVATKITGHKTEAVYRRYAIVSDADLRAAAAQIADGYNHGYSQAREVDAALVSV